MNSIFDFPPSRLATALVGLLLLTTTATAQSRATDALTLAKYDTSKNGRLDPAEITAMEAARPPTPQIEASATDESAVQLSPFEVRAEERGYYTSNATSGTRLNASS